MARRDEYAVNSRVVNKNLTHSLRMAHSGGPDKSVGRLHGATRSVPIGVRAPREKVQTHLRQMGLVLTSSPRRKAMACSELRMSSSGVSLTLPMTGWKKQGRTLPSVSMTVEVQGALQKVSGNSPAPLRAAK